MTPCLTSWKLPDFTLSRLLASISYSFYPMCSRTIDRSACLVFRDHGRDPGRPVSADSWFKAFTKLCLTGKYKSECENFPFFFLCQGKGGKTTIAAVSKLKANPLQKPLLLVKNAGHCSVFSPSFSVCLPAYSSICLSVQLLAVFSKK